MEKIIWAKSYMDSLLRLDPVMQGRANVTMLQFVEDKNAKSLRYEQLHNCREATMSSIRVTDDFRTILCWIPQLQGYLFLYVGKHDTAYRWAQKKVISLDSETLTLQIYDNPDEEAAPVPAKQGLFPADRYSDKSLRRLGVPEELLPLARSIQDVNQLLEQLSAFPDEVGERLFNLADGTALSELLEDVEANKEAAAGDPMKNPETLRSFVIGSNDPVLREAILQGSLEEWRVFLHPVQRKLVEARFAGPALVLGGAGTGKTITALHRAKALAARMIEEKEQGRILYTFYTVNLAEDISEKLRSICTAQEFQRIDVLNVDKLVRLNTLPGYEGAKIFYSSDKQLEKLWEDAISSVDPQRTRSADFYQREWERIIAEQETFTLEEYLEVKRTGGGTRLSPRQREALWPVFAAYQSLMEEKRQFDYKTAAYRYRRGIAGRTDLRYRHIIVDEAQDFRSGDLRLLRTLAGPERENDLFLVGDTRQRIYDRRTSLSACGIRVQGRVSRLWLNYRTTYELQAAAVRMLEGASFDNLDGETDPKMRYFSCTSGALPQVRSFGGREDELQWIVSEVRRLMDSGVDKRDICLAVCPKGSVKDYIKRLNDSGIHTYQLKRKADERGLDGIRVGTIYRIKGLEFQYMFIAGVNRGELSQASDDQPEEAMKRDKCLLYVALTRAQKGAYVSGFGKPPSEFLAALSGTQ